MARRVSVTSLYGPLFGFLLTLVALYLVFLSQPERVPYVVVHSLAELFGILVACSVFVVAWSYRDQLHNSYLLFVGIGYLFVGALHLLHLLAFRGMNVFPGYGADQATQLWVASRYGLGLAFLIAPLFLGRRLRAGVTFAIWLVAVALVVLAVFQWKVFPACYLDVHEPNPLTPFKKISEVMIGLIFLAAIPLLYSRRQYLDTHSLHMIVGALVANAAAEVTFLVYRKAEDPINLSGHLLLIVGAFLIFRALVQVNLDKMEPGLGGMHGAEEPEVADGPPPFDPHVLLIARTLARVCSVLVMAIGLLSLAGWVFEIDRLKNVMAGGITMKANTALCLTMSGLSLWLLLGGATDWRRRAGLLLAGIVTALGAMIVSEHVVGWDLHIDQLLFREPPGALATASPGRVGLPASTCFVLFGVSLLLLDGRGRTWRVVRQVLAILGGLIALLGLIGYLYDVPSLHALPTYTGIALHTALALAILAVGLLLARPDEGPMAVVSADRVGGVMARRLLLASILVPVVLGWIRILGERQGHYETGFGVSLLVLALVVVFTVLIWRNAALLNVVEEQREGARAARYRVEHELQEASLRLRSHVENSPLAVIEWDSQFRITRWTGAARQCFGWSAEEMLGKSIDQIRWIHEQDAASVDRLMREMIQGLRPHTINVNRNYRKDGSVVHCEWYNSALLDADGRLVSVLSLALDVTERRLAQEKIEGLAEFPNENPAPVLRIARDGRLLYANKASDGLLDSWGVTVGGKIPDPMDRIVRECLEHGQVREVDLACPPRVFAFVFTPLASKDYVNVYARDATERKLAEQALRRSEARFRAIFDYAAVGIEQVALDGTLLEVNAKLCQIVGYSREELLRKTFSQITHPDDLREETEHLVRLLAGEVSSYTMEKRYLHKSGHPVWVCVSSALAGRESGYRICVIEDITARKQALAEVRRLTETLERRVAERTAQLEEANRELESFSYSVSHDLRAPLRHIDGFAQLLTRQAQEKLDGKDLHYLKTITETVKHAGTLVDDLLAFSRMGRSEIRQTVVDVLRVVQDARRDLEPETNGRQIEWQVDTLPAVQADPAMLRVVFANLLANAVKFTRSRQNARIEIGCREQNGEFVFCVRDNGVGFDMKYGEKLFGVFQRLHRPEQFEGTGIGLANVRRIIHRHGGRTWAEGVVDGGATFYFSLPKIGPGVKE